jgi:hypothetical protein
VPRARGHGTGTGQDTDDESFDSNGRSGRAHANGHAWARAPMPTPPGVLDAPRGHGGAVGARPRCSCASPADLTSDGRCERCFGVPATGSLL